MRAAVCGRPDERTRPGSSAPQESSGTEKSPTQISYAREREKNHSPEVGEPFDELRGVVLVELDVGEVHLEHRGAGVAHPEEHELGFPQVHGGEGGGEGLV